MTDEQRRALAADLRRVIEKHAEWLNADAFMSVVCNLAQHCFVADLNPPAEERRPH
jgi:hypothetical protein